MGLVVNIRWTGLAAGTEVGVVTDGTLVSVTLNVSLSRIAVVAKRSVAVDTDVTSLAPVSAGKRSKIVERFIDRHEAVLLVDKVSIWHALGAVVPVWTVETLVADTIDVLLVVSFMPRRIWER
jgi:hypothetical protein